MKRIWRIGLITLALLAPLGGAISGESATVTIREADCRWLVHHRPAPDVAYRSGADVRGKAVAPADLSENHMIAPIGVGISLHIPLALLPPDRRRDRLGRSEVFVGTVDVDLAGGEVRYNGQALGDPAIAELAAACRSVGLH